jgi:uncharacterized membrane protein YtjA (UPF0391 family)
MPPPPSPLAFADSVTAATRRKIHARIEARERGAPMLHYALIFFVVALVAALLGMRGVAGMSAEIGYFLVVVAIIFVVIAFLTGRTPPVGP